MTIHEALAELTELAGGEHCSISATAIHQYRGGIVTEYRAYCHGHGFLGDKAPTIAGAMAQARAILTGIPEPSTDIELSDPEVDALVAKLEEQKAPR